jgi:hypothetical protein
MFQRFNLSETNYELICGGNGAVFLRLNGKGVLPIGNVSKLKNGSFRYWKRVKAVNRFVKMDAWGINYFIYSQLGVDGEIDLYCDDGSTYHITKTVAEENKSFLYFK